jgi:cell division protein FtsN
MDQLGKLLQAPKPKPAAQPKPTAAQTAPRAASTPAPAAAKPALLAGASAGNAKPAQAAPSPLVGAASGAAASAPREQAILGGGRDFTVHLSSFRDRDNAEGYRNKLTAAGEQAFISETEVNGQHWYRVMSGRFKSREDAASYGRDLKRRDLTADTGQYMIKSID